MQAWLLTLMLFLQPPGRSKIAPETPEDAIIRYGAIAQAIADVTANKRTAALLLAIAYHESGFRKDVDLGVGPLARGDHGNSCTVFQLNAGKEACKALLADRKAAASAALLKVRQSFGACHSLAGYTSGDCEHGLPEAKVITAIAERIVAR